MRLLRRTIKQLVLIKDGLAIFFYLADVDETPGHKMQLVRDESTGQDMLRSHFLAKRASGDGPKLHVVRSDIGKLGDRGPLVFELNTVVREYRISWGKVRADLTELAKLRWGRGWTEARIAKHLSVTYDSVHMRLRGLKSKNGSFRRLKPEVSRLIPKV